MTLTVKCKDADATHKYNVSSTPDESKKSILVQHGNIDTLVLNSHKNAPIRLTEWLINVQSALIWPLNTSHDVRIKYFRERQSGKDTPEAFDLELKVSSGGSRNCIELSFDFDPSMKVFFGVVNHTNVSKLIGPGFITYYFPCGNAPSQEQRNIVRSALSFAFGRYIESMGYTSYDIDWKPVKFYAQDVYLPGGLETLDNPSYPPTVIFGAHPAGGGLDATKLNFIVNGFVKNFNPYILETIMWLYWHAYRSRTPLLAKIL